MHDVPELPELPELLELPELPELEPPELDDEDEELDELELLVELPDAPELDDDEDDDDVAAPELEWLPAVGAGDAGSVVLVSLGAGAPVPSWPSDAVEPTAHAAKPETAHANTTHRNADSRPTSHLTIWPRASARIEVRQRNAALTRSATRQNESVGKRKVRM